jgi:hypothetical protein
MLFAEIFGFWSWFWIIIFLIGIGQAVKGAADIAKKTVENETVREAGKGIFAAWLESVFKK